MSAGKSDFKNVHKLLSVVQKSAAKKKNNIFKNLNRVTYNKGLTTPQKCVPKILIPLFQITEAKIYAVATCITKQKINPFTHLV